MKSRAKLKQERNAARQLAKQLRVDVDDLADLLVEAHGRRQLLEDRLRHAYAAQRRLDADNRELRTALAVDRGTPELDRLERELDDWRNNNRAFQGRVGRGEGNYLAAFRAQEREVVINRVRHLIRIARVGKPFPRSSPE